MITAGYHLSLQPGTRIEEYEILSVLGQGSFGITYLAEDTNLGARLAIKEYLPSDWAFRDATQTVRPKSTDLRENFEKGQDAFLKEARLLARVAHPNIVKVRRFFRAHGTAYIAMDFIDGRSFGDLLKDDYPTGGYPSSALKQLLLSLLDGIGALHETGIIHRDIKPGNVVIAANRNPILVDFGAARHFDRTLMHGMTVIVTPGYAPIEQYSDDGEQGPFTDIYALGALAYRAITGQAPDAPYKRLTHGGAPARIAGVGKYPSDFLAAVDWAIAVQPQDRPQTAAALATRLRDVPSEMPAPEEAPTRIIGDVTVALDPPSKRRGGTRQKDARSEEAPSIDARNKSTKPASRAEPAFPVPAEAKPRRIGRVAVAAIFLLIAAGAAAIVTPKFRTSPTDAAPSEQVKESADEAARKAAEDQAAAAASLKAKQDAAEAARAEAEREAAAKVEAERQAAATAALKAQQDAETARQVAAKAEADRQAAAAAALKAQQDAAAKAAAAKKAQAAAPVESGSPSAHPADARCTNILQTTQLMGAISDDDRAYLKDHCH